MDKDKDETKTQVEAARKSVLAVHSRDLAALLVTGKDAISWLNGLLTCDLVKRREGEARYGLMVLRSGRVLTDAVVVVDDGRAWIVLPRNVTSAVRAHLEHYLVMEDALVAAEDDAFDVWAAHGPGSQDVLAAAGHEGAIGGSLDRTGLGGAVILAPRERRDAVGGAIEAAVKAAGGTVGDDAGWEALRLERGVALFGVDFDEKTYPQEASLEKVAVSFEKGCYLGQEVVCMLQMRGHVKRKLAAIAIDGLHPPARGAVITNAEGEPIGEVTSAAVSPTLEKAVALVMLKRAYAEPGKDVTAGGVPAKVVDRPA